MDFLNGNVKKALKEKSEAMSREEIDRRWEMHKEFHRGYDNPDFTALKYGKYGRAKTSDFPITERDEFIYKCESIKKSLFAILGIKDPLEVLQPKITERRGFIAYAGDGMTRLCNKEMKSKHPPFNKIEEDEL